MAEVSLPTQKFVEIKIIKESIVYLKDGGLRKVLIVNGVNFDLKSEEEQALILSGFQNFLNTLDFSIQFFIHSRKININDYLEFLKTRKEAEQNELLKIQIEEYAEFIRSFVEENPIINKTFFVVVPYNPIKITAQAKGVLGFIKKTPKKEEKETTEETERENIEQLSRRVEQVTNGLEQIGLRATALETQELTELYYNLYNPQLIEKKGLRVNRK